MLRRIRTASRYSPVACPLPCLHHRRFHPAVQPLNSKCTFDRDTRFSFSTVHTQLKGEERFELIEVADPEVVRDLIASARVSLH